MRKLPKKYQEIYEEFYLNYSKSNSFFRKLSLLVEKWYHLKAYKAYPSANSILEIGAGNLNHVKFEKGFSIYDVVEPKKYLIDASHPKNKSLLRKVYKDISEIPQKNTYQKIIAIAVIEHIDDLNNLFEKVNNHLEKDSKFIIEIPAEGEFLWWVGWRLTTAIGFWIKYKLDYGVIMNYEHVNNAKNIISTIKKFFFIEKIESFPFNFKNGRLYIHIVCRKF